MRDCIYIGSTPPEEDCVSVGGDYQKMRAECQRYIRALRHKLGPEPGSARLGIKREEHDFGSYCEVVCYFDTDDRPALDYALKCEGEGPLRWNENGFLEAEAKARELAEATDRLLAPFSIGAVLRFKEKQ